MSEIRYRFNDSRDCKGSGYSGYVDENNNLVLEYDDPEIGGSYFTGSYEKAVSKGYMEVLKTHDFKLFEDIHRYYSLNVDKIEPEVKIEEKTISPPGVLWKVKLYMKNSSIHCVQIRGLNEASVIKKVFPSIAEVLTLQTYDSRVIAVRSDCICSAEFMED